MIMPSYFLSVIGTYVVGTLQDSTWESNKSIRNPKVIKKLYIYIVGKLEAGGVIEVQFAWLQKNLKIGGNNHSIGIQTSKCYSIT